MENIVNYEISETNRGKKQIIIDRKYKFNFSYKKVNNSKIYRCTHYKTDYKCKSFIILNEDNKIIKYFNKHNHLEEDYNAIILLLKHEINKSIRDETSLDMKPKLLYNNIEEGNWNKKKNILNKTEKINNLIEEYKNMEYVLIKNKSNKNDIINLWYECLKHLNTLDHNPNFNCYINN